MALVYSSAVARMGLRRKRIPHKAREVADMMEVKRTREEVDELLNQVSERQNEGGSRFPGQTFEEGVEAGIRWVLGEVDDYPYPED